MRTIQVTAPGPYVMGEVVCPECGAHIAISRKPRDNPLGCPVCGEPFKLVDEESGDPLNQHWAVLDTRCTVYLADRFLLTRFDNIAISQRWHHFEDRHDQEDILRAIDVLYSQAPGIGQAAWHTVIAMVEKKPSAADVPSKVEIKW